MFHGKRPYSIAILLSKMIPDIRDWNITILATDINSIALQRAACAVYGRWSFRDITAEMQKGFFSQRTDGHFELIPRIREMVTFSYLNLVEDTYPSLFDNYKRHGHYFLQKCAHVLCSGTGGQGGSPIFTAPWLMAAF